MKALSLTSHTQHFAVLLIAVLFIGCTVGKTSSLTKDLDNANATRLAAKYGDATRLSTAIAVAEDDSSGNQRNIVLNDLILPVDLNYNHWEKLLYDKKAGFDLSSDAVLLGLGAATALTGTTEVANILGQITTGIRHLCQRTPGYHSDGRGGKESSRREDRPDQTERQTYYANSERSWRLKT